MAKAQHYNKGTLRGTLSKSELVEFNGRNGKNHFLSLEVSTEDGNKGKATIFNTRNNPTKAQDLHEQFPVGCKVEVAGAVQEREYERRDGDVGVDRSINAYHVGQMSEGQREGVMFILQGIVRRVRELSNGVEITLCYEERYRKQGDTSDTVNQYMFTLEGDGNMAELVYEQDVRVGCNIKAKGQIMNKLTFDDYGDITGNVQMFKVEKIENVLQPEDLEEDEVELDFI